MSSCLGVRVRMLLLVAHNCYIFLVVEVPSEQFAWLQLCFCFCMRFLLSLMYCILFSFCSTLIGQDASTRELRVSVIVVARVFVCFTANQSPMAMLHCLRISGQLVLLVTILIGRQQPYSSWDKGIRTYTIETCYSGEKKKKNFDRWAGLDLLP